MGPTFTFPTASDELLGAGTWSMGPSAVGLLMKGPWVVGALMNNQWSFAGWGDKDVNQLLVQPFNTQIQGFYNAVRPDFAANWRLRVQVQFLFPK